MLNNVHFEAKYIDFSLVSFEVFLGKNEILKELVFRTRKSSQSDIPECPALFRRLVNVRTTERTFC